MEGISDMYILLGTMIVLLIFYGINRFIKRDIELQKKFNLLNWKIGDSIQYKIANRSSWKGNIVLFEKYGVYVISIREYHCHSLSEGIDAEKIKNIADKLEFIPARKIEKNISLEKRQKENKLKEMLIEDSSYHNLLTSIQIEYQNLNNEALSL